LTVFTTIFPPVSYSGTPAFFNVIGEMRQPKNYDKALYACQAIVTATYLTIGIVVYYFCGQYLANPALGSAGTFRIPPFGPYSHLDIVQSE
jgi:amino acid permease